MNESKPAQYTPQNPVYPGYGAPQNPVYPGAQTFDAPKPYPQQGAFQSGAYPASPPAPRVSAPRKPFTASVGEKIAAFLSPVLGYIYVLFFFGVGDEYGAQKWWLFGFSLGFLAISELVLFRKKRSVESWIWLFCLITTLAGITFGGNQVC